MRSPDSRRSAFETVLRVLSVVAMATLAFRFWIGAAHDSPEAAATTTTLDSALVTWAASAPRSATVRASLTPDARQRDWLVAIRRTGTRLSWISEDTIGSALVIEPGPLPEGLARLGILGKPQSVVMVSDGLGHIDSVRLGRGGAASLRLRPLGAVRVSLGPAAPISMMRDSLVVKPVLIIGSAGWEAKFVAAALEEEGWTVHSRMQVAPDAVVRQGSPAAIDTSVYGAVIVIDSVSSLVRSAITRFVNEGGGLVASGPGVRHPALRSLLPRETGQMPGELGALLGQTPRLGLQARGLAVTVNNVVFERRSSMVTASALRVGAGRVVAAGYDDTWRLRMVPPNDDAPRVHRQWWSSIVGGASKVELVPRSVPAIDEAPLAATVEALGPPIPLRSSTQNEPAFPWDALLAAIAAAALFTEWLSRRLRGAA